MTIKKALLSILFIPNKKTHIQAKLPRQIIYAAYFIHFLRKARDEWLSLRSDPTHLKQFECLDELIMLVLMLQKKVKSL